MHKGEKVEASKDLPQSAKYRCPYEFCTYPELILKRGLIRTPHFAHKKKSECVEYSEPETEAHIAMKKCFQETLEIDNEWMEYGRIEEVKPDILWRNRYPIELQHSGISVKEISRRNQVYLKNKLNPVWIFHGEERGNPIFERGVFFKKYGDSSKFVLRKFDDYFRKTIYSLSHIRLTEVEKHVLEAQGFLIYVVFEEMTKTDQLQQFRFDSTDGPMVYCANVLRYEKRKTLYIVTNVDQIRNKDKINILFQKISKHQDIYYKELERKKQFTEAKKKAIDEISNKKRRQSIRS